MLYKFYRNVNDESECCAVLCCASWLGCNAEIRNMDMMPAGEIQIPRKDRPTSGRYRVCNWNANERRTMGGCAVTQCESRGKGKGRRTVRGGGRTGGGELIELALSTASMRTNQRVVWWWVPESLGLG